MSRTGYHCCQCWRSLCCNSRVGMLLYCKAYRLYREWSGLHKQIDPQQLLTDTHMHAWLQKSSGLHQCTTATQQSRCVLVAGQMHAGDF